jgi:hypothetical protein
MIDPSRLTGLIDTDLMADTNILCAGVGGAASLTKNLSRIGLGKATIVDPDTVSNTNPATQGYGLHQEGFPKAFALKNDIAAINPACEVIAYPSKIETLIQSGRIDPSEYNVILAMTDSFPVQAYLNKVAVASGVDTVFAAAYYNAQGVEVTGTFKDTVEAGGGCHRCHTFPRFKAYADGFQPIEGAGSHIFQAEYLNGILGNLTLSLLHERAGSGLGNPVLARSFIKRPLVISRIDPTYQAGAGEAFENTPSEYASFTGVHWPCDLPENFTCPDCGNTASGNKTPDPHAGDKLSA